MQTAKTKGILLLLLLFTASLLLALGLALPRHTASAQSGVATVNGQTYDSFSAALAAAEEGDTVYVLKDRIDWMPSAQEIDANITIDLGSHASKAASGFSIYVKIAAGKTVTIQNGTFDGKGIKAIAGGEGAAVVIQNVKIDAKDVIAPALQIGSADSLPIEATVKDVEVSVHITATGPAYQNKTAVDVINADALLEGFTLNAGGENAEGKVVVNGMKATNSDMVVKNSTITSETGLGFGFFGGMTEEEAKADTANYNTLTLENSSVSGYTFALSGNGTKHGTSVDIQNSTLSGTIGAGIYHPQVGTLTVGGAKTKISGTSGIELRAGTLTVSGGEISATAETFEALPNEAGSTIDGAAIAVSQHTTNLPIAVNITGGTFNGVKALYEEDLQNEDVSNISVTVTGGTYEGGVESENVTGFISGGTFSGEVNTDYVASGSVIYSEKGSNIVGSEEDAVAAGAVAKVGDTAYKTMQDAFTAAEEGDTVYVLKDRIDWMPSAQEIDANITIDLGDHASKAASGFSIYLKIAAGKTVTIQNGTFDGKGIKAIAGGEGAAVVIQNVKIDAKDVIAPALQIGSADSSPIEATVTDVEVSVHITATASGYHNKTAVEIVNADALLEEFTLNAGGENAEGKVVVNGMKATNSDMVVKNSTITSETGLGFGFFGGMTEEEAKADTANYNTLTLENSSVSGYTFALSGNGTKHGTSVDIQNSTLSGTIGAGIYHPQVGTLTVGGAKTKISGTSGIELRAGTLTVSGGEISATAETFEALPNEAGSTIDGAAIAVSQHTTNLPIAVNITGGTFNGVKALYEEDLQNEDVSNISVTVSGGTYEGDVESENVTGFISGGSFKTLPDEVLLGAEYGGVLYNGYYVVVEETTDVGALTVAKLKAQADIRSYSASLGFPWTDLSALSRNEKVDAILAAYNAVDAAESEGAVAVARLEALDAIDAYHTYLKGVKKAALGEIETYAGQDKAAVAVPTYVISAINGAVSKEEIESYVKAAKAEIDEIREQRTKLAGNFETLKKNAEDLATGLKTALQAAIEGAVGANAKTLAELKTQLTAVETNIETEIAAIKTLLGTAADEAGNQTLFDKIGALEAKLTTVENNIKTAVTNAVTDLSAAVKEIADAVDALPTDSVDLSGIKELIDGLQADIDAANAALEGLDGEVSGLASLVGSLDGAQYSMNKALEAFEDAVTEQLTAIQTSLTALAADADDNGAAIAVLQQKADEIAADLQSGNADLTDVAENVVSLQSALEALSADVSAQGGMTGPIIGLYVIVSVLVVLMAAVLVILLKKKN